MYAYEDIYQDYNEETHKLALSISKPEKQNELQSQGKTPPGEKKQEGSWAVKSHERAVIHFTELR